MFRPGFYKMDVLLFRLNGECYKVPGKDRDHDENTDGSVDTVLLQNYFFSDFSLS